MSAAEVPHSSAVGKLHEFKMPFDPKALLVERACPKCLSNSVRRIKEEKK